MNGDAILGEDGRLYDHLTEEGAEALAARIEAWWDRYGYPSVQVWYERAIGKSAKGNLATVFVVRSNLVNGKPPAAYGLRGVPLSDGFTGVAKAALTELCAAP